MENKTALLFVDDDIIKIVLGKTLKCIPYSELHAPHNVRFVDQLFEQAHVLMVDKVSELKRQAFDDFVAEFNPRSAQPNKVQTVEVKPKIVESYPATKTVSNARPARTASDILKDAEQEERSLLFRSMEETCMIVDDCPTGAEIPNSNGAKEMLAIHPNKAVDLAMLPQDSIKNSVILKRLIREGKLVPCTRAEASAISSEYDAKMREDADARIEHDAPILDEPVSSFTSKKTGKLDMNAIDPDDIQTVEISDDSPLKAEKGELSLTNLMQMSGIEEGEAQEEIEMPAPPKKQLAQRPTPSNTSGMKPKGPIGPIGRR